MGFFFTGLKVTIPFLLETCLTWGPGRLKGAGSQNTQNHFFMFTSCLHSQNSDCHKPLCACTASPHWVCPGSWLWVLGPLGGKILWKEGRSLCESIFEGDIETLASSSLYFCFMAPVRWGGSLLHHGLPTMMFFLTTPCLKATGRVTMSGNFGNHEVNKSFLLSFASGILLQGQKAD